MTKKIQNYLEKTNEINALFSIYSKYNKNNNKIREKIFLLFYKNIIHYIVFKIKYFPRCLEQKDLINEGVLAIDYSLINYSTENYECDFVTFAKGKIKQQIDRLIRISHLPSIPIRIYKKNKKNKKPHKNYRSFFSKKFIEKKEYEYNPYFPKYLNPHQLYIKQISHELFIYQMKIKLSKTEYKILKYSYGISINNTDQNYQPISSFKEITSKLNITKNKIYKYRANAILKLKKDLKKYIFLKNFYF